MAKVKLKIPPKRGTVYVVTSGSYSDYRIEAVFFEKDVAEAYAEKNNGGSSYDECRVEEWPVGNEPDYRGDRRKVFCVWMDREGNTRRVLTPAEHLAAAEQSENNDRCSEPFELEQLDFYMLANDEEHAVKIANERRIRLIEKGVWLPSKK